MGWARASRARGGYPIEWLGLVALMLLLLHAALCEQRAKLGNTISELASFDLPTDDAQALANRLAGLSRRMCEALDR